MADANANPYRLPRTVEPERYELTLTPDLGGARFAGEQRVRVVVHAPVDEVVLNAVELEILSAQFISGDGAILAGTVTLDEETERATIGLSGTAQPGMWTLHTTFSGTLNDKLHGFYRSTFTDGQGVERVIATTQFEATDARRAFPCWDEPDFKAVFATTLIIDNDLTGLSNAALREETQLGNGKRQLEFHDTIKMSTYLVAFVVGPLVVTEPVDVDGVPLRVACVPGRQDLTSFALDVGVAALRYFAEYFKIPYPGGKLDMIAIPDFAFGAMENLGCVTFRETALLVDPERASRLEVERVADIIAHEIAHMWFGDLVTMKWWNGIWLNEAFATFMAILLVDHFRPEWERWVSFGIERAAAMSIDGLGSTRPIEFPVERPREAEAMFDALTYEKGGAVLRMLEQHVGSHEFSVGISAYLQDHSYGNAETTDLWDALERSTEQPVRALMDSWIFQGGYPVVHTEPTDDGTGVTITQRQFHYFPNSQNNSNPNSPSNLNNQDRADQRSGARWHVPVGIRAMIDNRLHHEKLLLTEDCTTVTLPGKADWLVVNERSHGFYRVSYAPALLRALFANLHALDPLERFTLANDAWAACLADQVELDDVIEMVQVMRGDDDPNVWGTLVNPLRLLDKAMDDAARPALQAFVRSISQQGHEWLGWVPNQGESERLATLRGVLITTLGSLGADEAVRAEARTRYAAYQQNPSALDANLVQPVEAVLASTNEPLYYEQLHAKFSASASTPQEKVNALQALACFSDPKLVDRTLAMISSGEVRTQDAPYAVRILLSRRGPIDHVWGWVEQNWDDLMARFPDNSIARMLDGVSGQCDPALSERVHAFVADHPVAQAQQLVEQICEKLRVNVAFYERHVHRLSSLFD